MKTDSISLSSPVPSLFQIAAFFEDFFPSRGVYQPPSSARHLPVAEFLLNPEKLLHLLRSGGQIESRAVAAMPEKGQNQVQQSKRPAKNATTVKKPEPQTAKSSGGGPSANEQKKVEFTLKWPTARSVKLAGDFTEWDKSPVEMAQSDEGLWFAAVRLGPGIYSYRFIVDGEWCDDPRSARQVPNPYGTKNAIVQVT